MSDDALFQKSLEYVLRAPKTERQVRNWLFKKRESAVSRGGETKFLPIDEIVNRLKELGYVNDAEYAQNFAQTKQTKIGFKSIQQKLLQKGIDRNFVDTAVSEIGDQAALARALAVKYMRGKQADQKTLQKLYRFLLSKGLEYGIVSSVLDEVKGDTDDRH